MEMSCPHRMSQNLYIGDGVCDLICNNKENLWDKGDWDICEKDKVGDEFYDLVCNNTKHEFDGGDCIN